MQLLANLATLVALAAVGSCQSITKVNDFNASPTKLGMYVYVPSKLTTPAPIIVAVHHCQGSATEFSTETHFMPLAQQHGFIMIYPNSRSSGGCFDVSSTASA
jgi:poly(3-hydroxybutyrate) depolymerase